MPHRDDVKKVLIIGSGPIIIGQACEFDYSGTQACKALRKLGYEILLVNSNPATIMTDARCSSKNRSWAGKSWSWRWSVMPRTRADHRLLHRKRGRHGRTHRRLVLYAPMLTISQELQQSCSSTPMPLSRP
jgi:hypothetical protein